MAITFILNTVLLTECYVNTCGAEREESEENSCQEELVEEAVVPLTHTVAHPRTVVVKVL